MDIVDRFLKDAGEEVFEDAAKRSSYAVMLRLQQDPLGMVKPIALDAIDNVGTKLDRLRDFFYAVYPEQRASEMGTPIDDWLWSAVAWFDEMFKENAKDANRYEEDVKRPANRLISRWLEAVTSDTVFIELDGFNFRSSPEDAVKPFIRSAKALGYDIKYNGNVTNRQNNPDIKLSGTQGSKPDHAGMDRLVKQWRGTWYIIGDAAANQDVLKEMNAVLLSLGHELSDAFRVSSGFPIGPVTVAPGAKGSRPALEVKYHSTATTTSVGAQVFGVMYDEDESLVADRVELTYHITISEHPGIKYFSKSYRNVRLQDIPDLLFRFKERLAIQNESIADRLIASRLGEDYAKTLADGKRRVFKKFRTGSGYSDAGKACGKAGEFAERNETSVWVYPVAYKGYILTSISPPLSSFEFSQNYVVDPDLIVYQVGVDKVARIGIVKPRR